ncbi:MAG: hypothetical protein Q7O12_08900 [Deltaproteobacteria bacterium]|nr:hypothetical protein [Deltaproteobacteria bacterium]
MSHNDKPGIIFTGGSGDSREEAIVIKNAENHQTGVQAEYLYLQDLQERFGEKDIHWKLFMQAKLKGEKPVDWLVIRLIDGTTKSIYFDISEFFGKG